MAKWKYKVEIGKEWNDESLSIAKKIDVIIERVQNAVPAALVEDIEDEIQELRNLQVEFGDDIEGEDFDDIWSSIYDWADANRVWINTFEVV
jgi:putative heme iron utilization protein